MPDGGICPLSVIGSATSTGALSTSFAARGPLLRRARARLVGDPRLDPGARDEHALGVAEELAAERDLEGRAARTAGGVRVAEVRLAVESASGAQGDERDECDEQRGAGG